MGHAITMKRSYKRNRAMLRSKKEKFKFRKLTGSVHKPKLTRQEIDDFTFSHEEMSQIKDEIRKEIKAARISSWIKVIVVSLVLSIPVFWIIIEILLPSIQW